MANAKQGTKGVAATASETASMLSTSWWMGLGKVREAARGMGGGAGEGAALLIREHEFVKVIEGIALDETAEEQVDAQPQNPKP
jgi:hypothetical protein